MVGYSLQEILDKTEATRKEVEAQLDLSKPSFHPEDGSIYTGLGDEDKTRIYETLRSVNLQTLVEKLHLKEYFGPSTTLSTGITAAAGAQYVIPDKIYQELFDAARGMDLTPLISNVMDTPGATLKIDCEEKAGFKPHFVSSGGEAPTETLKIAQGTITPRTFNISPEITNDMIEDSQFDLMERHLDIAGRAMGDWSTKMCLFPVMDDHRGTTTTYRVTGAYNAVAAGGARIYLSDFLEAEEANALDGFPSDVYVIPSVGGVSTMFLGEAAGSPIPPLDVWKLNFSGAQEIGTYLGIPTYRVINDGTTAGEWATQANQHYAGLYTTHWHALMMNKKYGIQTVRKRWLRIENYSDPIKDLRGAVISARQGHLVAYADAICVISLA